MNKTKVTLSLFGLILVHPVFLMLRRAYDGIIHKKTFRGIAGIGRNISKTNSELEISSRGRKNIYLDTLLGNYSFDQDVYGAEAVFIGVINLVFGRVLFIMMITTFTLFVLPQYFLLFY